MNNPAGKEVEEVIQSLSETWRGLVLSAGVTSGLFALLDSDKPVALEELVKKTGFDPDKIRRLLYYLEKNNFIIRNADRYSVSSKGRFFTSSCPVKEIAGLVNLTSYYAAASVNAKDSFVRNKSLDKLSDGRISRDYQPKVSDNFSTALFQYFHDYKMIPGDSVLDIGCGNASFLRSLIKFMPELALAGVDSNLFAIELGKKENIKLGLAGCIKLFVGDITSDMDMFPDKSYDWVTGINVMHFIPAANRQLVVEHMLRVAKKGVFMNEAIIEMSPLTAVADPLMSLLWNDFTGFFKLEDAELLNLSLEKKFPECRFVKLPILQNMSNLIVIQKNHP
jgi:ubiquinone/menaquinone biosynthesis C-methylase UbiE